MKKISPRFAGVSGLIICLFTLTQAKAKSATSGKANQQNQTSSDQGPGKLDIDNRKTLSFLENKGQIKDQYGQSRTDIQFSIAASAGLNIFIGDGAIHYQFNKVINTTPAGQVSSDRMQAQASKEGVLPEIPTYDMYRMDVELVGANKHARVITEQKQSYFEKHFTAGMGSDGATTCTWSRITYKEVYPNIDWVLHTSEGKLKHEFVVHKGGKIADIRLRYAGATSLQLNSDGVLIADTRQGSVSEQAPYAYTPDGKKVGSKFVLQGDRLSYQIDSYDGELIIDPTLEWKAVLAAPFTESGGILVTDSAQNVYLLGGTSSLSGIATTGAFQTDYGGGDIDVFLAKYNSAGVQQWATYYGGAGIDVSNSLAIDGDQCVYFTGTTRSAGLATAGAYQESLGGTQNAFIVKFNGNGERLWATYYGGAGSESGMALAADRSGNIFIAGGVTGGSDIATPGAFQAAPSGGYLASFNKYGERRWGTYYNVEPRALAVGPRGDVYMTGRTSSTIGVASPDAYLNSLVVPSVYDAFIAKFDSNGSRQWGTYYGGADLDEGRGIAVDKFGAVYVCGVSRSTSAIATTGSYQSVYHGTSGNAFLIKLSGAGKLKWGTYYGETTNEAVSVCTDSAANVYVAGTSSTGMATDDAYLTSGPGFLAEFDSTGARVWSTYLNTGPTNGLFIDGQENIYTAGVFGIFDIQILKFNTNRGKARLCIGSTTTFTNPQSGGVWSSSNPAVATVVPATGLITGLTVGTAKISYFVSGQYIVSTVTVNGMAPTFTGPLTLSAICSGSTFNYTGATTPSSTSMLWNRDSVMGISNAPAMGSGNPGEALINATNSPIPVVYVYTLTANGCSSVQNVTVTVNPSPSAISGPSNVCTGTTVTLSNTVAGGAWSRSNTNVTIGSSTGIVTGITAGTTGITYTLGNGCAQSKIITINTTPVTAGITGASTICSGASTTFSNVNPGGTWLSSNPDAATVDISSGVVTGVAAGSSVITYTITGAGGCTNFSVKTVSVNALPPVPPIAAGSGIVCPMSTLTLTESTVGGTRTWTSDNTSVATVNSSTGVVTGVSPGTATISYNYTLGCTNRATTIITVAAITTPTITATPVVCVGSITTLSGAPAGGTWISSTASKATIGSATGIVTGVSAGTSRITYTYIGDYGCVGKANVVATVNAKPSVAAIAGSATICAGITVTLTDATPGGAWSSTNASATIDGSTGSITGIAPGTTIISYIVTGANGCVNAVQKAVTVNALPSVPAITGGDAAVCQGTTLTLSETTTGGTHVWSSDNTAVATVNLSTGVVTGIAAGTVTISYKYTLGCINYATTTITVNPKTVTAITGTPVLCANGNATLYGDPADGVWASGSPTKATIGATTGYVSGVASGTAIITYTYTNEFGCVSKENITATINALPSVAGITGISALCEGATGMMTNTTTGGEWLSSDPDAASINSAGLVTGNSAGTASITYTFTGANGCIATRNKTITVNALPSVPDISTGTGVVCPGATLALTESTSGGTHVWTSATPSIAAVNASTGVVTGVAAGVVTISYRYTSGCTNYATANITVNPVATVDVISGLSDVVAGATITLENATPGGVWSSGNTAKATVGAASGIVTGVAAGTANITYTVTGCGTARAIQMVTVSAARPADNDIAPVSTTISIFPNPTTGTFTLQSETDGILAVYTLEGKLITQYNTYRGNNTLSLPYDIAAGVYLCRFAGNDGSMVSVRLVYRN